jgi:hypothetical protein
MPTIDQEITLLTTELLDALTGWRTARTTVTEITDLYRRRYKRPQDLPDVRAASDPERQQAAADSQWWRDEAAAAAAAITALTALRLDRPATRTGDER